MRTRDWCQFVAVVGGLLALATGCGSGVPSSSSGGRPGTVGVDFLVTVLRPTEGTVTSADGRIDCGSGAASTRCGPVSYAWADSVVLTATPDAGMMFGTWAGDCLGRGETPYQCTLDTSTHGADKYVVAVFGEQGRAQHTNFTEPALHGAEFLAWIAQEPDAFECTYCHGSSYGGLGIALSCNGCHAAAGFPNWRSNCNFCHLSPPVLPPPRVHPPSDLSGCAGCHPTTVDGSGNILPGGTHMNGQLDGGGHADGYAAPAVHGRDFFAIASSGTACQSCHGAGYGSLMPTSIGDQSCNSCHASAGWVAWASNCSFCHGLEDATTQLGYDVATAPQWAAPPDAVSQRLDGVPAPDRTGAHQAHLLSSTATVLCSACHGVPSTLGHISGRDVRAEVILDAPGQAIPDPLGYDPVAGTCATYCHDRTGVNRSPAWTFTGLACDGCHSVPPATSAHLGLTGADLGGECSGCHPGTITSGGAIDLAAGGHVNGTVESPEGHAADFALPSVHGPQFLDTLAGLGTDCRSCHGTGYNNCDACHSSAPSGGWVDWETNCTFCHGTRTPAYTAANLTLASPPDSITQRLTGSATSQSRRIGKHREHLVYDPAEPLYPAFPCEACHPVPSGLSHVSADRRAAVAIDLQAAFPSLSPAEVAALPNNGTPTYDPSTNRCAVYCHGSTSWGAAATNPTSNPLWATNAGIIGIASCTACHGSPPPTGGAMPEDDYCLPTFPATTCGMHEWHGNLLGALGMNGCTACHDTAPGQHLNAVPDVLFRPQALPGGGTVSGTWDRTTGTCSVNCHSENPQSWR